MQIETNVQPCLFAIVISWSICSRARGSIIIYFFLCDIPCSVEGEVSRICHRDPYKIESQSAIHLRSSPVVRSAYSGLEGGTGENRSRRLKPFHRGACSPFRSGLMSMPVFRPASDRLLQLKLFFRNTHGVRFAFSLFVSFNDYQI